MGRSVYPQRANVRGDDGFKNLCFAAVAQDIWEPEEDSLLGCRRQLAGGICVYWRAGNWKIPLAAVQMPDYVKPRRFRTVTRTRSPSGQDVRENLSPHAMNDYEGLLRLTPVSPPSASPTVCRHCSPCPVPAGSGHPMHELVWAGISTQWFRPRQATTITSGIERMGSRNPRHWTCAIQGSCSEYDCQTVKTPRRCKPVAACNCRGRGTWSSIRA